MSKIALLAGASRAAELVQQLMQQLNNDLDQIIDACRIYRELQRISNAINSQHVKDGRVKRVRNAKITRLQQVTGPHLAEQSGLFATEGGKGKKATSSQEERARNDTR